MNHAAEDEDDDYWPEEDLPPEATFSSCLASMVTILLALLSMVGGILTSALAFDALVQRQPDTMVATLNTAAFPLAFSLLVRGFACQSLVAFGLFTFQFHRQVKAMIPGMVLVIIMAFLLGLIRITA